MEKRAIRVSHELWKQIMTEGYTSGGIKCVKGLPKGARLVGVFSKGNMHRISGGAVIAYVDPVFVYESNSWDSPSEGQQIETPWGAMPQIEVHFEAVYD